MGISRKFTDLQQNPSPISIIGLGVTGLAVLRFCLKQFNQEIFLFNNGSINEIQKIVETFLDKHFLNENYSKRLHFISLSGGIVNSDKINTCLVNSQFIMRSPGVDPRSAISEEYQSNFSHKEIGEIELAFLYLKYQEEKISNTDFEAFKIISITGTNGKTTTVHLLDHLLKENDIDHYLGGNVGFPLIDLFEESIFLNKFGKSTIFIILELSSFQTEQLNQFESDVVAILNITSSHQERYDSYNDYFSAKEHLLSFLKEDGAAFVDSLVLPELKKTTQLFIKDVIQVIAADNRSEIETFENDYLNNFPLIGIHNLINACFAKSILEFLSVKINSKDFDKFRGVPFRLEKIGLDEHQFFYNDAKSTNDVATLTAVNAMNREYDQFRLIMGGQKRNKNIDFNSLFEKISSRTILYCFGESAPDLVSLAKNFKIECFSDDTLENVIKRIQLDQSSGDNIPILFSPGFPSFDQYKNYLERGNECNRLVNQFLKK